MRELLMTASERAIRYLEGLDGRRVFPDPSVVARLSELETSLPEHPSRAEDTLALLDSFGAATMAMVGPRFFAGVVGGVLPATLAATWLVSTWDQNTCYAAPTPLTAKLEEVALHWLRELFGLPPQTGVGFVTGATMANFSCLVAARHRLLAQVGWDVESDGLFGAPSVTVVVGEEAHPTLFKSLGLAGFGRNRVVRVPVDQQGRMRADQVPSLAGPTIVCLQAGNVNTGAFDPAQDIIPKAKAADAWVHVDGAFGLWAATAPSTAHLLTGYAAADSWATDAHKYLNTPYDCGLALVRDPEALRAAMAISAAYLPAGPSRDPADFTPELSRRARGVDVWAALHSLGRSGLAELVEQTCRSARRFAEGLHAAGYCILNEVVLNQVLVSFGDAQQTQRVITGIQQEGTCWCSETRWQGQTAMRISISSWATTDVEVDRCLEAIIRVARSLA
jgi:glutamate/tyrosine decarboxylase-like PLP-dependent enzyme